jgi:hypothetical protein
MPAPPVQLDLLRLIVAGFHPPLDEWRDWTLTSGSVTVSVARAWEKKQGLQLLLVAARPLEYRPKVSSENQIFVPEEARRDAEIAAEFAANLIAATQGTTRHLSSAWPPVMLRANGPEGEAWLSERAGLRYGRLKNWARLEEPPRLTEDEMNQLADRADGLSLLAEGSGISHASGRFHEYIRVFERGFGKASKVLASPLTEFLDPRFGFTVSELEVWFKELRDPLTHADQRPTFLLERDINPVIDRVEQAATDVVFNKVNWRQADSERRALWTPQSGFVGSSGKVFLTKGARPPMQGRMLDEYGSFPMNLGGKINPIPKGWWPQDPPQISKSDRFSLEIIEPGGMPKLLPLGE